MPDTINVVVKLFAAYQEAFQCPELQLEFPPGTTIEQVCDRLIELQPSLAPWRSLTQFGRNLEQVAGDTALEDGDEVVMIPPVSGG
jgi:sulfur-carrier protein